MDWVQIICENVERTRICHENVFLDGPTSPFNHRKFSEQAIDIKVILVPYLFGNNGT